MIADVEEFSEKFGCQRLPTPGFLNDISMKNRLEFQLEELLETAHAAGFYFNTDKKEFFRMSEQVPRNLPDVLDGLIDQVYVALGTAISMGFMGKRTKHLDPIWKYAWDRVHRANMKKIRFLGSWRVQKPEGWIRPNLEDLCE